MDVETYHSIEELRSELNSWRPQEIPILTRDGSYINLMDYIGESSSLKKGTICPLPLDDNCNQKELLTHRQHIVETFAKPCADAGFKIIIESFDSRLKCHRINVVCKRGVVGKGDHSEGVRNTSTGRPTCKEEKCPFRFNIYWIEDEGCWCLKAGYGVAHHFGHVQLSEENVHLVGSKAKEFCIDALKTNVSPGAVKALAKQRFNVHVSSSQIEYWQRLANPQRGEHATAAESLLQSLKDAGNISFVALYDDPNSSLLHVRQPRGEKSRIQSTLHSSNGGGETFVSEDGIHENTTAMDYIQRVRSSMSMDNGQKMLLAVAWCSDDERHFACLNPDVLAADVTEQTNCEKRPLMMLAGLTGNQETFTLCRAFLPSQQRWVFDWFFGTAVPFLFPPGTLMRNRMMLTDGDEKEYNAFLCSLHQHYPNSRHHLCTWHLLDRGMRSKAIFGLCSEKNMCNDGVVAFNAIKLWIQSWFKTLETEQEFQHSFSLLHEWLRSDEVIACMGMHVIDLIVNFINNNVLPHKSKWLFALFLYRRTFDRQSSQIVEVENSAMKRASNGPKPFHAIDKAACSMILLQDLRNGSKTMNAANVLSKRSTRAVPNDIDRVLNHYSVEQVLKQRKESDEYRVYRQSHCVFYVKRKISIAEPTIPYNLDPNAERQSMDALTRKANIFVPKYERTRLVSIVTANEKRYLTCSCGLFERHGFPCRHLYAVLERDPMPYDVIPRYHKAYESFYQRDQRFTEYFDSLLNNELPGPPTDASAVLTTPITMDIPDTVTATLPNRPVVLSRSCMWSHKMGNVVTSAAHPRLQLECSLSQAASEFCDEAGITNDDLTMNDGEDEVIDLVYESDNSDPLFGNTEVRKLTTEATCLVASSKRGSGGTFHSNWSAMFQEYCKMSEWGPKYESMLGEIMLNGFEQVRREYAEDQKKKRRHLSEVSVNGTFSSHMEARGPKKAKRLKPMGSPSK